MGKVVLVDENDNEIGLKERALLTPKDITRLSILWLTNSKNEVLMAQRALQKKGHPGLWSVAAGGMVDEGEHYDDNVVKETQEEIGLMLDPSKLTKGDKLDFSKEGFPCFIQWYSYTADVSVEDLTLQEKEVMAVRWYTPEELKKELKETPEKFTPLQSYWMKKFL